MSQGYATAIDGNALVGAAASAFAWGSGYTAGRQYLNDGHIDAVAYGSASTAASPQTLVFDLGVAQTLVGVALLSHNLNSGVVTVQVDGMNDAIGTGLVAAKAATFIVENAPNDRDSVLQFPAVSKRFWRLTFTHSGGKRISLGEVMALKSIATLTRKKAYGWGESEVATVNRNEGRTGRVFTTQIAPNRRTKRWPFVEMAGTTQRDELMAMWRASAGGVQPLLWIESVESSSSAGSATSQECLYGRMRESLGWSESDFLVFDVDALELVGDGRGLW